MEPCFLDGDYTPQAHHHLTFGDWIHRVKTFKTTCGRNGFFQCGISVSETTLKYFVYRMVPPNSLPFCMIKTITVAGGLKFLPMIFVLQ